MALIRGRPDEDEVARMKRATQTKRWRQEERPRVLPPMDAPEGHSLRPTVRSRSMYGWILCDAIAKRKSSRQLDAKIGKLAREIADQYN